MDKHSKCSLYRLRMALAISIAFCFTTDIFAQATSATDSMTAIATPDTVGELVNGLNTVWMLLAAMLVFFLSLIHISEPTRLRRQRTEHRMDAACRHAGILHAAGLCTGRSRFYKSKKYGQYPDEELR